MGFRNRNPFEVYMPVARSENRDPTQIDINQRVRSGHLIESLQDRNARQKRLEKDEATRVELPSHLYIPEDGVSLDFRKNCVITPGTTREVLMEFTAPVGCVTRFIGYGVFTDALFSTDVEFVPLVDNSRVFPYHGDPGNNFKISLGLGPDLSNINLVQTNLSMQPGQIMKWLVSNLSSVETVMGVRMVGFYDMTNKTRATRFGS
jgi:hypothetical protein